MTRSKIKNTPEDFKRMQIRDEFAKSYKKLNSLAGSNTASCYSAFKLAFYNVKSGVELLKKKGLPVYTAKGKIRPLNVYLDHATYEELEALNNGLNAIHNIMVMSSSEFPGYPYMYDKITKIAIKARYEFVEKYGEYPEYYMLAKRTIASIKRSSVSNEDLKKRYENLKNAKIVMETSKPTYEQLMFEVDELKKQADVSKHISERLYKENKELKDKITLLDKSSKEEKDEQGL